MGGFHARKNASNKYSKLIGASALALVAIIGLGQTLGDDPTPDGNMSDRVNMEASADAHEPAGNKPSEPSAPSAPDLEPSSTPSTTLQSTTEPQPPTDTTPTAQPSESAGSGKNNFDKYDDSEQQQTEDTYVLNTSTMKIHRPSCSSVPKIAPQNCSTSSESITDLKAQGYSTCGICFK